MFASSISIVFSQPYNNNWINYSQQYYKFKVSETGVYRIDSTVLVDAGIPLSSINPRNFQLFARAAEVPIYIEGENDGIFNGVDFIEFHGKRNDGWLDEQLYGGAQNHPNPYYSLINDTINYYLTWNSSLANNRLIVEFDTSFTNFTPVSYFNKEVIEYYSSGHGNSYYDGESNVYKQPSMGYILSEGWFDDWYNVGASKTKNLSTQNAYSLGPDATVRAVVLGESDFNNPAQNDNQHLRVSLASNVFDTVFGGYKKIDFQMNIPISDIGSSTTAINFESVNDLNSTVAYQTISYIELKYPHNLNLEGLSKMDNIFIESHPTESKSFLNFSNFNPTGNVVFYDLTNGKRIDVVSSGSNYRCLVPNSLASEVECLITSEGEINNITSLVPVGGSGTFIDYANSFIDTAFIIITHPSLMLEANNYANYRSSTINNPQNPIIFNIEDLYDQFSFGVEKHPLSIRSFIDYIVDSWPSKPNYLFLMGKSIKASQSRKDLDAFANNLVPSFGVPASDNMLTSGLNGSGDVPLIPTGRLSAKNETEISWYLQKVDQYENPLSQPTCLNADLNDWKKRVLHFGGGASSSEQNLLEIYLNNYKNTIEDTLFGGNTISFFKSSTAPIQTTLADTIKDYIEDGVALMTFLGHASVTGGFDQNIDDISLWPNQNGKYPFLLGLGCLAGDIHGSIGNSNSEEYVIQNEKGVIGYLSSVSLELPNDLNSYASEFYKSLSYKNYGASVGNQINNAILFGNVPSGTAAAVTLHGDPAIVINTFELPDYFIETSSVTFNPTLVTSDIDSFDVNVLITNFGKAIGDTIVVEILRDFPGTSFSDTVYVKAVAGPNYQQIVSFRMAVDIIQGLGMNQFTITVDAVNTVDESCENNNVVTSSLNILSGEIVPIFPYEYMIVPDSFHVSTALKASTAFPFEPAKDYIFEIDTTDYFNSGIKESVTINSPGGVVEWAPTIYSNFLPAKDSVVYFWRVSKDSVDATGYNWRNRSFQRILGKEGWEQDHFFQF